MISYGVRVHGVSCSHSPEPCWSAPPAPSLVAWEVWVEEAAFFARLVQSHSLLKLHWLSFWPLGLRPVHAPIPHQPHSPSLISTSNPGGLLYANCFLQEISVSKSKVTKDGHSELQQQKGPNQIKSRASRAIYINSQVYKIRLTPEDRVGNEKRKFVLMAPFSLSCLQVPFENEVISPVRAC